MRIASRSQRITKRKAKIFLIGALTVGFAVRCYLACSASVISRDGVSYLSMARSMMADWRTGIPYQLHFGYPLLVRWAYPFTGWMSSGDDVLRWQHTGQVLSIVFGLASIVLVFLLGRRLVSWRAGLLAAWIWALLPEAARLSADVLTDMPHLSLVLLGLLATMVGLRTESAGYFFWAGLLSGAAYTMRPEGGEVALVAVVLALLQRRNRLRGRFAAAAAVVAGFALFGGAYIWSEGGTVFSKKTLTLLNDPQVPAADPAFPPLALCDTQAYALPFGAAVLHLILKLSDSLNGVWLVLGIAYLLLPGRRRVRRRWVLAPAALWGLHSVILIWLHMKFGYIARRHVMLLNVALVILAAATLNHWAAWLSTRVRPSLRPAARSADAGALAVICLALLPWLLRDINDDRRYLTQAAHWVRSEYQGRKTPRIYAQHGWVPFYAGLVKWFEFRDPAAFVRNSKFADVDLAIIDIRDPLPSEIRVISARASVRLTEAARFTDPSARRGIIIYTVQRLPPPAATKPTRTRSAASGKPPPPIRTTP